MLLWCKARGDEVHKITSWAQYFICKINILFPKLKVIGNWSVPTNLIVTPRIPVGVLFQGQHTSSTRNIISQLFHMNTKRREALFMSFVKKDNKWVQTILMFQEGVIRFAKRLSFTYLITQELTNLCVIQYYFLHQIHRNPKLKWWSSQLLEKSFFLSENNSSVDLRMEKYLIYQFDI